MVNLKAIIFDLDGVITDTAEYHYQAWRRLADEEGLPFDRNINERLRGVSRRDSLQIILAGRPTDEDKIAEMMARKNRSYNALLEQIAPADLLPGVSELLQELRAAGIKVGIGSVSKNARTVIDRLGIAHLLDAVADGYSTERAKPAPDIFLEVAKMLEVPAAACAVVEDAASGIEAALAAGMWAIGLGPAERVGHAHLRFDSLIGVRLADILSGLEVASWTIAETEFVPERQHHKETVFTVGNGYLCVRGSLEEGYPGDRPACFVHRLWDYVPLHYEELANIPHWWGIELGVNGQRFRLDQGRVLNYRRTLNLREGILSRLVRWQPTQGGPILDLHFERFASLANPHQMALRLQIHVTEGQQVDLWLRTGLNAHLYSPLPAAPVDDMGLHHWRLIRQEAGYDGAAIQVRTRVSGINLALATTLNISGSTSWQSRPCDVEGQPSVECITKLGQGDYLNLEKFVAVVSDYEAEDPWPVAKELARRGQAEGYASWRSASESAWAQAWDRSDVVVEGDIAAQIALRFSIFQLLIAAPRWTDRASIGAKTLSGFGYRHHVFWDAEIFMLPLFTFTQPELARNMLMYRWHNLTKARAKAAANGYEGAQFPWESASDGREVTPAWVSHFADPTRLIRIWTGDIEVHITADIAYGAMQYWLVTGDDNWMRDYGAELVLDGAKFWASAARREADGKYHFRNVIGPDEYHDHVDDNAFTNFMAQWHLATALEVLSWLQREHPAKAAELTAALDLNEARLAHWADVIGCMFLPEDPETGLIEQFTGYFALSEPDFAALRDPNRKRSMQALLGTEGCAQTQILKQPDVLMLPFLLPERFGPEQLRINYDYYNPRTDHEHGSSLGPGISAVIACRAGDIEAAYQHFLRASQTDLQDVRHNSGDGIHGANAGGVWQTAVFGFAGLRLNEDGWKIEPRLPPHWTRLAFKFYHRGKQEIVDICREGQGGDERPDG